jgi:hypothetical protein
MLEFMKECFTDKGLVIIALIIIGVFALYVMEGSAENIITAIVSGLCGIAVGKSL